MNAKRFALFTILSASLAVGAVAQGNGNGKGKGGGNGGGGNDGGGDPPAEFVPVIAYKVETRKYEDIRLSNVEGDQSCLVLRVQKDNPAGRLLAFDFSASTKRLAYSLSGDIYVGTWTDSPCEITFSSSPLVSAQQTYEGPVRGVFSLDFSPDGQKLITDINPLVDDDSRDFLLYDFATGSLSRIDTDFVARRPRFSPDFANDSEVFFRGRPSGIQDESIRAINLDTGAARLVATGLNYDVKIEVSNTDPALGVRIAAADNDSGLLYQYDENGIQRDPPIAGAGTELAYSCDNSQIIYRFSVNWRNNDAVIANRDGSNARTYSSSDLRDFKWLCE